MEAHAHTLTRKLTSNSRKWEIQHCRPTIDRNESDNSSQTTATNCASTNKADCNSARKLAAVYDDEEDDDKDEDEVVNEDENQQSSYNIHKLSQLDFTDLIELKMYENENLLFPDYTLNLS